MAHESQQMNTPSPKGNRFSITKCLLLFFILTGISIAFAPILLSTDWGQNRLLYVVNRQISGRIEWKSISLSWFGKQSVNGFSWIDSSEKNITTIDHLSIDEPLMTLLLSNKYPTKGSLDNLNLDIPVALLEESLNSYEPRFKGLLVAVLGERLALNINRSGEKEDDRFQIHVETSQLQAQLDGHIKDGKIHFHTPEDIVLKISPLLLAELEKMTGQDQDYITFLNPEQVSFNLSHLSTSLSSPFDFNPIALECVLNLRGKDLSNNLMIEISGRPGDSTFSANLSANSAQKDRPLAFNFHTTLPKTSNIEQLIRTAVHELKITGEIAGIPLEVVDRLLGLDDFLFKTFGPYADLKIQSGPIAKGAVVSIAFETRRAPPAHFKLTFEGLDQGLEWKHLSLFQAKGVLEIESLAYLKDVRALWEIDGPSNRIDMTMDAHTVYESGRLRGRLQVNNWRDAEAIQLDQALVKANFEINQFVIDNLTVEKLNAKFEARESAKVVEFSLQGTTLDAKRQRNHLQLTGGYLVKDGQATSMTLNSKLQQLPTSLFGMLPGIDHALRNKLEAIFGSHLTIDLASEIQEKEGQIKASIQGTTGEITLDGNLHNGILTLNQPLVSTIQVTPSLGRMLFQERIPLLGELVSAEDSIRVTISPEGVSIPLTHFDLSRVNIPKATIELGRMHFRNDGQLAKVLSTLRPSNNEMISIWFTPLYLHVNKGVIKLERTDMLIGNTYPLAAWGNIDLVKQWVDMKIGLSGIAIAHAFNLPISENTTLLQMTLRGPLANPSLDKTKVMTKIGALAAQSQGPQGLLLGSVIQIATGLTEEKAPAPTTNPLPWSQAYDGQATAEGTKQDKPELKPIKQIEKKAGNLIRNLFK